ncbi:MAG: hypothetical protein R3D34_16955 [Nitratireductor sp.]
MFAPLLKPGTGKFELEFTAMAKQASKDGNQVRANRLRNALRENLARRKEIRHGEPENGEAAETRRRSDRLAPKLVRSPSNPPASTPGGDD